MKRARMWVALEMERALNRAGMVGNGPRSSVILHEAGLDARLPTWPPLPALEEEEGEKRDEEITA